MLNKKNIVLIFLIIGLILGGSFYYLNQSYQPLEGNERYLDQKNIIEDDKYYHFKTEDDSVGIIFYPGGKVQEKAYAPICNLLQQHGYNIFLVKMPFNLAVFDKDRADIIITEYEYKIDNWYIIGHSLGGAMAASYLTEDNIQQFKGIIFLASYPPNNVVFSNTNLNVLSINASNDQVIDRKKLEEAKNNLPADTEFYNIVGGNHSGFGYYGPQKGDGKAEIEKEKQWNQTVDYIINFIKNIEGE